MSAAVYHGVTVFFHNEQMYPEPQGFWTIGGRSAGVTVAAPPGRTDPDRAAHPQRRRRPTTPPSARSDGSRRYALVPGTAVDVELPMAAGGVIPLTISTDNGFSPKSHRSRLHAIRGSSGSGSRW